ncbi:MAG TPA: protoporphyrinogen oxidase [Vicinamibacterales bacterium]|nr:protoporphyrinogen oxidase [Vicinamibacterales bacterium]
MAAETSLETIDVAVIGAGVSGLAAAYELRKRKRSVIVLEREQRAGGIVMTERVGEFIVDAGPDALLVQKPAAVALCNELGIGDRLIPTKLPRTAYVLRDGELHSLPSASVLGFPTRLKPLFTSSLFGLSAKFRMAAERVIPRTTGARDESIAGFVRRRFGVEAVTYIAEPLLAGIHAGDVDRLSMRALFPRLVDAEAKAGSVIKAFRREPRPVNADGVFRSFPNGLEELIHGLMKAVPKESVRCGANVTRIEERADGFMIHVGGQRAIRAAAVILAIPAFAAADLLRPLDADLSDACGSIRYLSTATVVFAFPRDAVRHRLQGTGFVVPRAEGLSITAGAWISSKWPYRAPEGQALLRAFLGGARDPDVLSKTDAELAGAALRDLTKILGIHGLPIMTRVYRWNRSSPQQEVGHGDLMQHVEARLAMHRGLFVSAAGFRGVGIPDCIGDARKTAEAAAQFVRR